ncbi:MAG: hypothetical protein ACUVXG_08190 [Anaerolineae bacterium]
MDLKDKLKADRNALDELVAKIPGFRGYKEREIRRDADRLIRQHVSRLLEEQRKRLSEIQAQLVEAGRIDLLDDLERLGTRVQGVINKLKTAAYGYAGLFDAVKVNEEQLDALYRFDQGLLDLVAEIRDALDSLAEAVESEAGLAAPLKVLRSAVGRLSSTVRKREAAILEGQLPDLPERPAAETVDPPEAG